LQAAYGHLAIEYVSHDFPGISLELDPGVYFQDNVTGDAFDIPIKAYTTIPLKKDKIFAVVGLGWSLYQDPIVAPRWRDYLDLQRQASTSGSVPQAGADLSTQ